MPTDRPIMETEAVTPASPLNFADPNVRHLADLLEREGRHSGVWFGDQLIGAAELIRDAAARLTPEAATSAVGEVAWDQHPLYQEHAEHGAEPSIRELVRRYYRDHFGEEETTRLVERYLAALRHPTPAQSDDALDIATVALERISGIRGEQFDGTEATTNRYIAKVALEQIGLAQGHSHDQ